MITHPPDPRRAADRDVHPDLDRPDLPGADHTWSRVELRSPGPLPGVDSDPNLPDQLRGATSPVFVSVREPATPQPEIALPDAAADDDGAQLGHRYCGPVLRLRRCGRLRAVAAGRREGASGSAHQRRPPADQPAGVPGRVGE